MRSSFKSLWSLSPLLSLAIGVASGAWAATTPQIISSQVRSNDPTVLDVVYKVTSDKPTVNVRALAFEDGERSFWKVVRPETFIDSTAANIGDNIAANVEHTLSWKVSSDWATDLAKVKFEILTSEQGQLPMDWVKIPGVKGVPDIEVTYNSQTDADVLNALFWYYADGTTDITNENGRIKNSNGELLAFRDSLYDEYNYSYGKYSAIEYIAGKMGLEVFGGTLYHHMLNAVREPPWQALSLKGSLQFSGMLQAGEKSYCVIDVSEGASAISYPVDYFDSFPIAGWGDEYKTKKILLRRIEPGNVMMGGQKLVTLTRPFYIGVFEITQRQYELVMGVNPSYYRGATRPVDEVSWNTLRGNSNWPNNDAVGSATFFGKLRSKTGLNFDLPTESQWEYSCRAGTTTDFNNGGADEDNLRPIGRFGGNQRDGRGGYSEHTVVGSYSPNAWGLYDMHGNVFEWCLDWVDFYQDGDPEIDYKGPVSGNNRSVRGGAWISNLSAHGSSSSSRNIGSNLCGRPADSHYYNYHGSYGFRICLTLSDK